MTEPQLPPAGAGPSPDDKPFVASGVPNPVPAGEAFKADPDTWYHLKVHFIDDQRNHVTGRVYSIGANPSDSFWDYMALSKYDQGGAKCKLHPLNVDGWEHWEINDGNYLSLKATGWVYRSSAYPIGWKVVDGKLYCSNWGGPVGYQRNTFLVSDAYYMGMGLPEFTCELVPA